MRVSCFVVVAVLATTVALASAHKVLAPVPIPPVRTANSSVVVGLSAGAFAAVQYHISYSSVVDGAGIIAGGPFYCAQDTLTTAETACLEVPFEVNVQTLLGAAKACAQGGVCDSLDNLQKQKVWLYSGSNDHIVVSGIVSKAEQLYQALAGTSNVEAVIDKVPSGHGWPTKSFGNLCSTESSPYINNCGYSASEQSLNYIWGNMKAPAATNASRFFTFEQKNYIPGGATPASISMGPLGYAYVPEACEAAPGSCRVALALHGCQQTIDDIGTLLVEHSEMAAMGEANNIVVIFPQVIKVGSFCLGSGHWHERARSDLELSGSNSTDLNNPCGCFDWWGEEYTGSNYANQKGPQMATMKAMFDALVAGTLH